MVGRIGHGSDFGIMVSDGILSYSYFQNFSSTALNNKVLYFNCCDVHNPPLEPAIVDAGIQRFIEGNFTLEIGPSEEVFKCFLEDVIVDNAAMTPTISNCEEQRYLELGAHGISGNGADYLYGNPDPNPKPEPEPIPVPGPEPTDGGLTNGQLILNLSASQIAPAVFFQVAAGRSPASIMFSNGSRT
jgi:hypothetical protein